jgi:hypothetical protein
VREIGSVCLNVNLRILCLNKALAVGTAGADFCTSHHGILVIKCESDMAGFH